MSLIIRGNALYRKILYEVYVSNRLLKLLQKQKEKQSEHYVGRVLYSNQSEEVKCCTPLKCFSKNTVLFANNILHQRMWLHRGLHWRINITGSTPRRMTSHVGTSIMSQKYSRTNNKKVAQPNKPNANTSKQNSRCCCPHE
nr:PREDICTED: uncharacterized protein LOC106705765 isoform X1 [Latimeria chalumnae]|eukprot:XP_014351206.1 PREDICTED: uncharacterized protein LOC106705765 isoform X1 [Latimeria chalumnae]